MEICQGGSVMDLYKGVPPSFVYVPVLCDSGVVVVVGEIYQKTPRA